MHDDNQTFIPDSFIALYRDERQRLTVARTVLAERYEFCEDMANMLVDHCQAVQFRDGAPEAEILRRCHKGLSVPPATVDESEAVWVVRRTAELLQWPWDDVVLDE